MAWQHGLSDKHVVGRGKRVSRQAPLAHAMSHVSTPHVNTAPPHALAPVHARLHAGFSEAQNRSGMFAHALVPVHDTPPRSTGHGNCRPLHALYPAHVSEQSKVDGTGGATEPSPLNTR